MFEWIGDSTPSSRVRGRDRRAVNDLEHGVISRSSLWLPPQSPGVLAPSTVPEQNRTVRVMFGMREQASSIGAIRACAGLKLRSWRSWLSLTVVVGLAGGAVLACVAGSRRTDSAYARFARSHLAADMIVYPSFASAPGTSNFDRVARLPQVKVAAMLEGYNTDGPIAASPGAAYGQTVNVPKLLSGRLPRPDQANEVAVTYTFARDNHLAVGSSLDVRFLGSPPMPGGAPSVLPVTVRVVGIEVSPGDFPPALQATFSVQMVLTPAFLSTYGPRLGPPIPVLMVRFVHGDPDATAFETGLRGLTSGQPQSHARLALQADNVQRGIHLQAVALWLLAGFLAFEVTLVLYQLLARQSMLAAEDNRTLRALGLTRTQLWLSTLVPPIIVGLTGAAMALVVAVAVSPLLPAGTARMAEPHPRRQMPEADASASSRAVVRYLVPATLGGSSWLSPRRKLVRTCFR